MTQSKQSKQLSRKKLLQYKANAEIIQWGRRNPVLFAKYFFGIELLDYQAYVIEQMWNKKFCLVTASRNAGKSFIIGIYTMLRDTLLPNYQLYIMSGVSSQSQETFGKIEKIAKRELGSLKGTTDVFANEIIKSAVNKDGFLHNPASFRYNLYNGSFAATLNSEEDSIRGKRSNCNIYDEAGFMSENYINVTTKFLSQNENFQTGGDLSVELLPKQFPNQSIFMSSASSTDMEFWKLYKLYAKEMIMGNTDYFVADLDCEIPLHPTKNGKPFTPLLTQEQIDNDMAQNKEKALREYYNIFSTDGGEQQPFKRATIIKNSKSYLPILANDGGRKFCLAYDPARNYDNSVVLAAEFIKDEERGWYARIANCVSFVDIAKKTKTPIRTPEQVDKVLQMIIDYNGKGAADYENIIKLALDSGAGGAGRTIADYFMPDWADSRGVKHSGMIDKIENQEYVSQFPNAQDTIRLVGPAKYKTQNFDATVELLNLGLIEFPNEYDGKGYITVYKNVINKGFDKTKPENEETNPRYFKEPKQVDLSFEQELSLINIDLLKEEMTYIRRFDGNGTHRYDLPPDLKRTKHDDKMYCLSLIAGELQMLRRGEIVNKNQEEIKFDTKISFVSDIQF